MNNINDFVIENGILLKYRGNDAVVEIPDGVTCIGHRAFYFCKNLVDVRIPDSVTEIGKSAFFFCTGLKDLTIHDSVTTIGDSAFYGCRMLADERGFVIVNNILFDHYGKENVVVIPDGVKSIGQCAFDLHFGLTDVVIPKSVTSIGERAFKYCDNLRNVTVPDSVKFIGADAFSKCSDKCIIYAPNVSLSCISKTDTRRRFAYGFLSNPNACVDTKVRSEYKKYVIAQRKKLLPFIYETDMVSALIFYAENGKIDIKNYEDEYFIPATEANALQCVAFLTDWKNKNIF